MAIEEKEIKEELENELSAIRQCLLIEKAPERLRAAFKEALNTKTLCLSDMGVTDAEVNEFIIPFLIEATGILSLDLSNPPGSRNRNQIGAAGATALARNATITNLNIANNHIGDAGATALARNATITNLDVAGSQISDAGATSLAANATITTLNVAYNQIGDAGAAALTGNATITNLDVASNQIGVAGATALAANATITNLDVADNQIGDAGATALAGNATIINLNVAGNYIGDAGATALAGNATIINLNVAFNQIGVAGQRALQAVPVRRAQELKERNEREVVTFLIGTHSRVGAESPLLTTFKQNNLFDRNLLREIFDYQERAANPFKLKLN